MTTRTLRVFFAGALAAGVWCFLPSGQAVSQRLTQVLVTNFPAVQEVRGAVELESPVRLAKVERFSNLVVPPVSRAETTRLVDGGVLVAEGFPALVLSLHGETRGQVQKPGDVGVILLPDEPTVQEAFDQRGLLHFSLETLAPGINSRTPFFASAQPRYQVAFPRYRVLLYNTTDKTVTANLFAYLTQ